MKLVITLLVFLGLSVNLNLAYAASGAGMDITGSSLYNSGKKLIIKAKKLEKKEKIEKAEKFYLEGLKIDAAHLGINEYLGELYVQTNRIELAKERLQVLKGCNCEEYEELKELIEEN